MTSDYGKVKVRVRRCESCNDNHGYLFICDSYDDELKNKIKEEFDKEFFESGKRMVANLEEHYKNHLKGLH